MVSTTSSSVRCVLSTWTAPSAMVSGAVARPESIRSRSRSTCSVAVASLPPSSALRRVARADVGGTTVLVARGARALAGVEGCGGADVLVTDEEAGERPCLVLDARALRETGSVAGWPASDGLRLVTAAEVAGDRPWTGR